MKPQGGNMPTMMEVLAIELRIKKIPDTELRRKVFQLDHLFQSMYMALYVRALIAYPLSLITALGICEWLFDYHGWVYGAAAMVTWVICLYLIDQLCIKPLYLHHIHKLEEQLFDLVRTDNSYLEAIELCGELSHLSRVNAKYYLDKLKVPHSL